MTRIISLLILSMALSYSAGAQDTSGTDNGNSGYRTSRFNAAISYGHDWQQSVSDTYAARVSYEFLRTRHFSLTANGGYTLNKASFSDEDISYSLSPQAIGMNGCHNTWQLGLMASFRTVLFDKPVVGAAIVNSDWAAGGFAKVSGIVFGMVMLRSDRDTQFGIGPLFLINTNGKLPALLTFLFRHRFNEKWLVNLSGGLFAMEYSPTKNDLISVGMDIGYKSFYFNPSTADLPDKLRFLSVAFRPMVRYSRDIVANLSLDVRAGLSVNIVNRATGTTGTKKYLDIHQQRAYPFVQAGASYRF